MPKRSMKRLVRTSWKRKAKARRPELKKPKNEVRLGRPGLEDDGLGLPVDEGRDDAGDQDHRPDEGQVAALAHAPGAVPEADLGRPGGRGPGVLGGEGAPAPAGEEGRDDGQGDEEEDRREKQKVVRVHPPGQESGQHPAGHAAQDAAAPEEADQALGLPGIENVVDQDPELGRQDHDEDVGPHPVDEGPPLPGRQW